MWNVTKNNYRQCSVFLFLISIWLYLKMCNKSTYKRTVQQLKVTRVIFLLYLQMLKIINFYIFV